MGLGDGLPVVFGLGGTVPAPFMTVPDGCRADMLAAARFLGAGWLMIGALGLLGSLCPACTGGLVTCVFAVEGFWAIGPLGATLGAATTSRAEPAAALCVVPAMMFCAVTVLLVVEVTFEETFVAMVD